MLYLQKSIYHSIIKKFNQRKFNLVITTDIFLEYEEIFIKKANKIIAADILNAFLQAPNVKVETVYYQCNLITVDPDDNKFIDAYLTAQADYLVTNDGHFEEAKNINIHT